MFSLFGIATTSLFAFQMFVLHSLGKKTRTFIYSHKAPAAGLNLAMSVGMVAIMGVGNVVGLANLSASTLLASWIVTRGTVGRKKAVVKWKKVLGIPVLPGIEIVRKNHVNEEEVHL